jgi:alkylated DNA repair dioxygenase AlkB
MPRAVKAKTIKSNSAPKRGVKVSKASAAKVTKKPATKSKAIKAPKASVRGSKGNSTKTTRVMKATKAVKTPKISKSTQKQDNTKTLIRSGKVQRKRKVVKLSKRSFVNNRYDLDGEAYLEYYPNFLTKKKQKDLLIELTGSDSLNFDKDSIENDTDVPWQHGHYSMYGRDIPTPRLLYAMRDSKEDITNSYTVTGSMHWTKEVEKLRNSVVKQTGEYCRYAQMNLYRDGNDYIGFHTDSEVEEGDLIASISLGAERTFKFISTGFKKNAKPLLEMTLEPGSLLIMSEYAAKHNWKHELPKDKDVDEMRINITFRPN